MQEARIPKDPDCMVRWTKFLGVQEIEARLKQPILKLTEDLSLPPEIQKKMAAASGAGQASYGDGRSSKVNQVCLSHEYSLAAEHESH